MKKKVLFLVALVAMLGIGIQAQTRMVTGLITDEAGSPLPGVSVVSKTTSESTVSDTYGKYAIKVSGEKDILRFNFIGMVPQDIKVGKQTVINVVLKADVCEVEEVMVVAYGSSQKRSLTGAISGIKIRGAGRKGKRQNALQGQQAYFVMNDYEADFNTENYASINENGYKQVTQQPLSTFSVDVDRAAYTNVRRFLNSGQMPPHDAVRIEEMINYFDYEYEAPADDQPFAVKSELAVCPWNTEHHLLKIGLKGREIEKDNLPPSNLVFLIDVSGSMSSNNKLPLLKSSFRLLVNELRPEDHVAIVVYAGAAGVVLQPTSGRDKKTILAALDKLEAGGSTAGGAGLKLAYKLAKEHYQEHANNRIILATDGDFNVGVSSNAAMEELVEKERDSGIFMTVLGFGMGNYKDDCMEIIADKGNGNYAYIDNLQEAQKTLVSEFGGTLFTIAKDVKFQIEFNPAKVLAYRLIGYENRLLNDEDFNDDTKDAGEIGAGHTVTALYEIIPVGAKDSKELVKSVDKLKYQKQKEPVVAASDEWLTLKLRYKQPNGNKSQLMERPVSGVVKRFEMAGDDFRFAAAVAGFGMLLSDSQYKGDLDYETIRAMAKAARGEDEQGFKAEMIRLVKTAESLDANLVYAE
ncbi:von Willebrand factor type A domain-containing protein [Carboxylicivirga sediminis]|uniref:von Willebrand factor type A domain-containing protein n=1 Tax=Carboxylicivirga sediminis TaxID=2006564 RepID=A0A941IZ09_9BACT|nr:VWA domain-containing protein [Carboxylicivirga sediminis]MBR8537555.1 von Willebrand factor type A domain-containing protein [Carboxylicivirga sediminis]